MGTEHATDTGESAAATTGPIFVVGSMRSGSTMLRLILDSHEHIAIPAETGFMGGLSATKVIPTWRYGDGWYRRLDWAEHEVDARLREFYSGMFQRYAHAQGKRRWGEKTPFHTAHVSQMAQVFPDSVFVGIVRHPGAVAASLRKNFHYAFPEAVEYWSATNRDLVRQASHLGRRFVLCRYEDLVTEGEPVIRELVHWLGEPWSPGLLEHHRVQREKGSPRAAEGSTSTRDPIDASRAASWVTAAGETELVALESVRSVSEFFGYDPVDPDVRTPLPNGGQRRWLSDGDDLRAKQARFDGRIDFTAASAAPPMVDARPEELAARLARAEQALVRVRSRRAVRLSDAMRRVQHGRSARDVRDAWRLIRGHGR